MGTQTTLNKAQTISSAKVDIRVGRSEKMIRDTFLEMLAEMNYEDIHVKDIADRAMVNRKTFYAHYENKQSLYDEMVFGLLDELCETLVYRKDEPSSELDMDSLSADCKRFIEVMENHREEFMILINPRFNYLWFPILEALITSKRKEILLRADSKCDDGDIPYKLYLDMITSELVIWIYWWISQEEYTVDEGAVFLARLMNRSMANVFRYVKPASTTKKRGQAGMDAEVMEPIL